MNGLNIYNRFGVKVLSIELGLGLDRRWIVYRITRRGVSVNTGLSYSDAGLGALLGYYADYEGERCPLWDEVKDRFEKWSRV